METGLDEMWADGVCCTGVLAEADPARIAELFGTTTALVTNGQIVERVETAPLAYVMRPTGSQWTVLEFHERVVDQALESGQDYLLPLFEQALGAINRSPPSVDRFVYETPVSLAAHVSRTLGAPSIALWGSDEHPGLAGGVIFAANGSVELVCSAFDKQRIETSFANRRALQESHGEQFDEEEEWDEDEWGDEETTYLFPSGDQGVVEKPTAVFDFMNDELQRRSAAFDNADLLQDLCRAILAREPGEEFSDVDVFYVVTDL
jgi:hypothetical protein